MILSPGNHVFQDTHSHSPRKAGALYIEKTLNLLPVDAQYNYGKNKTFFSGGGGLYGTAYDYFRFGQMMLNKGKLDGVCVLGNKAVELTTQPILDTYKESIFTGNLWVYNCCDTIRKNRKYLINFILNP